MTLCVVGSSLRSPLANLHILACTESIFCGYWRCEVFISTELARVFAFFPSSRSLFGDRVRSPMAIALQYIPGYSYSLSTTQPRDGLIATALGCKGFQGMPSLLGMNY